MHKLKSYFLSLKINVQIKCLEFEEKFGETV